MKSKLRAFAGVIISTASISAFGATEWQYSENDRTLTVIVPAGETNSFAVADADSVFRGYLTSNAVTNFVKLGSGGLYVDLDLYSYAGDLTVAEGTYTYTNPKALGNYYYSSGIVSVKNGATLNAHRLSTATEDDWGNKAVWGKRIWFEGAGADGRGALVYTSEGTPKNTRLHFSCNLKMTGNATIYNAAAGTLRLYGTSSNPASLDMGGHALTLDGATAEAGSAWSAWRISNPGSMAVRRPVQLESTYSELGGTDENVMSFDAGGALLFNNFGGKCGWTIDARNLSKITVRSGASASLGSVLTHSFWGGNIITGAKRLQVYYLDAVCNFTVGGTISGAGLYVYTDWRGGYIFNLSGFNSFTDGLAVKGDKNSPVRPGNLYVYSNGALPADGGALTLTDATVTFRTNDRLSLPPLSAVNATAVNSGIGTWRDSIVKTGSGNLSWNSLTGGDVLDVREGGVVIRDEDRSMIAGLVEGELLFRNGTTAARAAYGIQHTNRVDYSMSAMYDSAHPFWTTPFPSGSDRRTFNYWGYVWNNDPTNVKWSVALYAATHLHLIFGGFITGDIDGSKTGYYNGTSPSVYTVELPPGPTPIQLSGYYTAASSGLKTKKDVWTRSDFGLGYDVLARASGNSTDYAKMIDPGDGSLFTWAMPKQIVEGVTKAPGSDEVVRLSPYFGTMKFAAGTGVTFRRGWYQVPVLEGLPAVNGITNALTVTSAFKFSAREVVAGRKLTTTGTFVIGEGASIVIDDADGQGRRSRNGVCSFVIAQADSVMMPTSVTVTGDTERWAVERSADGKSLLLKYKPKGTIITLY